MFGALFSITAYVIGIVCDCVGGWCADRPVFDCDIPGCRRTFRTMQWKDHYSFTSKIIITVYLALKPVETLLIYCEHNTFIHYLFACNLQLELEIKGPEWIKIYGCMEGFCVRRLTNAVTDGVCRIFSLIRI